MSNDIIIFDSEIIPSHYLFCARRVSDKKVVVLWGHKPDDMVRLRALLANPTLTWVGFNSNSFDLPLATAAGGGASVKELKEMADRIIAQRRPAWMSYRDEGLEESGADSIDLMEVAPGVMISLKLYGARMGSPNLLDMPIHHEDSITDEQAETVLLPYCINDLDETERLYNEIIGSIKLREQLSEKYKIDLRSKSDAQMAETIIAKQLGLLRAPKPAIPKTVTYRAPAFIQPKGAILKDILHRVQRHTFTVTQSNGAVELPEFLKKEHVLIGDGVFQMGVGGLHSKHDKCISYVATPEFEIVDADIASHYPATIINAKMSPRGLGKDFLPLYTSIRDGRVQAKRRAKELMKLINDVKHEIERLENREGCLHDQQQD